MLSRKKLFAGMADDNPELYRQLSEYIEGKREELQE